MVTKLVLLEVIERGTKKSLLPIEEREVRLESGDESAVYLEFRAKRSYLLEIEQRLQYAPKMRAHLAGKDWCIDCTVIN